MYKRVFILTIALNIMNLAEGISAKFSQQKRRNYQILSNEKDNILLLDCHPTSPRLRRAGCHLCCLLRHSSLKRRLESSVPRNDNVKNIFSLSTLYNLQRPHATLFDTTLAEFYLYNPHLVPNQQSFEDHEESISLLPSFLEKLAQYKKPLLRNCSDYGPLIFFCWQLYKKYNVIYSTQEEANQSWLKKSFNYIFPSIFANTSKNMQYFLGGTELLIQAYLLKILLKMIVFCLI